MFSFFIFDRIVSCHNFVRKKRTAGLAAQAIWGWKCHLALPHAC